MTIATGVFKKLSFKKQTGLGVIAAAGAGGTAKYLRRVKSTIDLAKTNYQSGEILPSQQRRDMRHGVRSVAGTINGELSVGTYEQFIESVCRQLSQTVITTGAQTNITAAVTSGAAGTYTRAAGSFLTDGFMIGDVVTCAGWATTGVPNNTHYGVITSLTALVMTVLMLDGVAVGAKASGDSVTISQAGQKTWIPATGQTRDYYTIEHWHSDIAISERHQDCVIAGFNVQLPPTGMATIDFNVMGLNTTYGTAEYFTTPGAPNVSGILASVNGALLVNGVKVGLVTGLTISVNGTYSMPGGVVGQNTDPDIFPGPVDVTGQATILFDSATYRDLFVNETVASIAAVLTADNSANPAFTAFVMPTLKFSAATKDDGTAGLTLTMPFTALENTTAGAGNQLTTLSVQDSQFT